MMRAQNTENLVALLVVSLVAQRLSKGKYTKGPIPLAVGIAMLVQSIYGSKGIVVTPSIINKLFDYAVARFLLLFLMMFGVTRNPVTAVTTVVTFLVVMQLLRTPEERRQHPYII